MSYVDIDRAYGAAAESAHHKTIEKIVGCGLIKDTNRYAPFDFFNSDKTLFVEQKTRRLVHNAFSTTLVPLSKIKTCEEKLDKRYFFVFVFLDGIWYIEYDKERFAAYERTEFRRNEANQSVPHIYIPIAELTQFIK